MLDTTEMVLRMIKSTEQARLTESLKTKPTKRKLTESKKVLKEADEDIEDEKSIPDEELDLEDKDIPQEDTKEIEPDEDDFIETIDDSVYFCAACDKHFVVAPDVEEAEIACPSCSETTLLVKIGNASSALKEPDNKDVAEELEDEEHEEREEQAPSEEFDESDLEEGFNILANKHIQRGSKISFRKAQVVKENLEIYGVLRSPKSSPKPVKIVFEGFSKNKKKSSFILEGSTTMFKGKNMLRAKFIREGKKFSVRSVGYGFINESTKQRVKGILG